MNFSTAVREIPYYLVFGRRVSGEKEHGVFEKDVPVKCLKKLEGLARRNRLEVYEKRIQEVDGNKEVISVGGLAWWRPKKSGQKKFQEEIGPYVVEERLSTNVFVIKDLEI